ncbi:pancreatic triacylglycerol lipase [Bactrocera dorsalis]|uniref:Pancreatic triacylglycerol lipase n=1 Tax=Bactrocera dorsalis TaxID=27457 RepID=A0A6I9V9V4_BACDO|nr:pancreatic triacylglycerol lipase [Bactrocera dorsalis]
MSPNLRVFAFVFTILCALANSKFSYEPGNCDILIKSAVSEILKNEMRARLRPSWRESRINHLRYELYTPQNPYNAQVLKTGDANVLRKSFFNAKLPVRISIHGWTGKSTSCSNAAIKDAYLAAGKFNVIILDWSAISMGISYIRVSGRLHEIATKLLEFTQFLHLESGVPYESIYLVGHSAGAHIAGLAGKQLRPQRYGAIYALDPAGLAQLPLGEDKRLAPNDAIYTESIHSDVAMLGNPSTELTQASFFVNYGLHQPQCPNATAAEFVFACNHFAAIYYFAESLRQPRAFGAIRCRRYNGCCLLSKSRLLLGEWDCGCPNAAKTGECPMDVFMGGEPAVPKSGIFYLSTRSNPQPFGYGETVRIKRAGPATYLHNKFLSSEFVSNLLMKFYH